MKRQPSTPVEKIEIPQQHFSHINVDLGGHLPMSHCGNRYLLTVIDRSTKSLFEFITLGEITAEAVLGGFHTFYLSF